MNTDDITSSEREFTVLTEEYPNIDEIRCMMEIVHETTKVSVDEPITPCISNNKFNGRWNARIMGARIHIVLFKGKTSSVDYLLFAGTPEDCASGSAEHALCILESTKTSDKESRNTAVNQRIVKFTTYFSLYPNSTAIPVMFWLNASWELQKLTPTAIFGFRLMSTLGIRLYMNNADGIINMGSKLHIDPFSSTDEMIEIKNSIPEKKGNTSVKLEHQLRTATLNNDTNTFVNLFKIIIKLDKGNGEHSGKISHDPNVGLLSGILNAFHKLAPDTCNNYLITNHGILQSYFDKCPKSKLWHSTHGLHVEFENVEIKTLPDLPTRYFVIEQSITEKLATILCQMTSEHRTIFTNHAGCALTSVADAHGCATNVGRTMNRPDILFEDSCKQELILVEGKVEADIHKGVTQLGSTHLATFIELCQNIYPEHSIRRGLCVTIDNIKNLKKYEHLQYPILFALDASGEFIDLR